LLPWPWFPLSSSLPYGFPLKRMDSGTQLTCAIGHGKLSELLAVD
jgi:hypothetical protein